MLSWGISIHGDGYGDTDGKISSWSSLMSSVLPYGLTCLAAHILLVGVFKYILPPYPSSASPSKLPPWKAVPSFTAHQIIALWLMVSWTITGLTSQYNDNDDNYGENRAPSTSLKMLHVHPAGIRMAQRSMAALWIWDIPVMTFAIKKGPKDNKHADLIMHLHHIGMLILCCIMVGLLSYDGGANDNETDGILHVPIGSCYAPVFLGIVELSSIPLQIVDLFHPHKGQGAWYNYIKTTDDKDATNYSSSSSSSSSSCNIKSILRQLNEISRQLFAMLFLLVRGIYFPYVVVGDVVPNLWTAFVHDDKYHDDHPRSRYMLPFIIIFVFSVGFTILQMYWAILVVQQIIKALSSSGSSSSESKASSAKLLKPTKQS